MCVILEVVRRFGVEVAFIQLKLYRCQALVFFLDLGRQNAHCGQLRGSTANMSALTGGPSLAVDVFTHAPLTLNCKERRLCIQSKVSEHVGSPHDPWRIGAPRRVPEPRLNQFTHSWSLPCDSMRGVYLA